MSRALVNHPLHRRSRVTVGNRFPVTAPLFFIASVSFIPCHRRAQEGSDAGINCREYSAASAVSYTNNLNIGSEKYYYYKYPQYYAPKLSAS
jgi:hypothetical protein